MARPPRIGFVGPRTTVRLLRDTRFFGSPSTAMNTVLRTWFFGTPVTIYTYVGSGGMTAAGSADIAATKDFIASGGLQTGGASAISAAKAFTASGGLAMSGEAATSGPIVARATTSYVRRAKRNNLPKVEDA